MDKALGTVLMITAAVVCVVLVLNAVFPAISSSSGAMTSASARMSERIKSDIEIIHAAGEYDDSGTWQDTNSDTQFDVFVWVKNVGTETIKSVESCDLFIGGNDTLWAWIPHTDYASGSYPQWDYTIENGTVWKKATTLKIEVSYEAASRPSAGEEYDVKVLIPNGVSDEHYFSM
jgi:archaellum component FlaG (FlaF/FlaG flagellin family)